MKPTDLFGFLPSSWHPKFCHHPKTCHHEKSPRGSQDSGIQKISLTPIERSAYPDNMVEIIALHVNDAVERGVKSWFICIVNIICVQLRAFARFAGSTWRS